MITSKSLADGEVVINLAKDMTTFLQNWVNGIDDSFDAQIEEMKEIIKRRNSDEKSGKYASTAAVYVYFRQLAKDSSALEYCLLENGTFTREIRHIKENFLPITGYGKGDTG